MAIIDALNRDLVRRRRSELGLSVRMMAREMGLTGTSYTSIENGRAQGDLSIGVAVRLAKLLSLSLDDLIRPDAPEAVPADSDDAEVLGSLLAAFDHMVPRTSICEAAGWTLDRYTDAELELERRLASVGMALHRLQGRVSIVRRVETEFDDLLADVVRRDLARNHVGLTEARLIRSIEHGDAPTQPSNADKVAQRVLTNAELITFADDPSPQTERAAVLADDVRFSLMLDELPNVASDRGPGRSRRSRATKRTATSTDP